MATGKWIEEVQASTPLVDAARHVLMVRLNVVREFLPLAIHHAASDVEHVHQLRVATRRARSALEIFRSCLPSKAFRKMRRELKSVRQLAGQARDWDVFLTHLKEVEKDLAARSRPALDFLMGFAFARRQAAQEFLERAAEDYPFRFDRCLAQTVAAVQKREGGANGGRTLGEVAGPLLMTLVEKLEGSGSGDLDDAEALHEVRIAGKRLRYAMEIFADCYGPAFRDELYPAIEQMQEILGQANDSQVAVELVESISAGLQASLPAEWKRQKPGLEALLNWHRKRITSQRKQFQAWWEAWHSANRREEFLELVKQEVSSRSSSEAKGPAGDQEASEGAETV